MNRDYLFQMFRERGQSAEAAAAAAEAYMEAQEQAAKEMEALAREHGGAQVPSFKDIDSHRAATANEGAGRIRKLPFTETSS